jgi:heme oxygenase
VALSPTGRPPSVRAALRSATHDTHQRMHGLAPFEAILNGTMTAQNYPRILHSLLQFHSAIGAAAVRHGWSHLSGAAERTDLLLHDLRRSGGGPRRPAVTWQPRSPLETLGALYAAEGSTMGGRVIGRQLDYLFGRSLDARRFFSGTPGDAARWHALVAALEEHCATTAQLSEATCGALSAFRLFEHCIMSSGVCDAPAPRLHRLRARTLPASVSTNALSQVISIFKNGVAPRAGPGP